MIFLVVAFSIVVVIFTSILLNLIMLLTIISNMMLSKGG